MTTEATSLEAPRDRVAALFEHAFGRAPTAIASAPGRVNLIGEHTDYNGGEVLPIAIAQRTVVAVGEIAGVESRAVSANEATRGSFATVRPQRAGEWWDYVAGTAAEFGATVGPLPAAIGVAVASDVPEGAGLSSSAALEVATAVALAGMSNVDVPLEQIARMAHQAENAFVGVESGIMDQYASALARRDEALHVWCDTGDFEHVPMHDGVLVFDTSVPRSLRHSAYNQRRAECDEALRLLREIDPTLPNLAAASLRLVESAALPEPLGRRARHVVTETARVRAAVASLVHGGTISGELLTASQASLRDDYECSSPELDWFVDRVMREPGVRGARLTGAGWGGCAIALGDPSALARAVAPVTADYSAAFGREGRCWVTSPEGGASIESVN